MHLSDKEKITLIQSDGNAPHYTRTTNAHKIGVQTKHCCQVWAVDVPKLFGYTTMTMPAGLIEKKQQLLI